MNHVRGGRPNRTFDQPKSRQRLRQYMDGHNSPEPPVQTSFLCADICARGLRIMSIAFRVSDRVTPVTIATFVVVPPDER